MSVILSASVKREQLSQAVSEIQNHYLALRKDREDTLGRFDSRETRNPDDATRASYDIIDFKGLQNIIPCLSRAVCGEWPDQDKINALRCGFDLPDSLKMPDGSSPARDDAYKFSMEILRAFEREDSAALAELITNKRSRIFTKEDAVRIIREDRAALSGQESEHYCDPNPWKQASLPVNSGPNPIKSRAIEENPLNAHSLLEPNQIANFARNFLNTLKSDGVEISRNGFSFKDSNNRPCRIFDIEEVRAGGFGARSDLKFKVSIEGDKGILTLSSKPCMLDGTFRTKFDGSTEREETVSFTGARETTKQRYLGALSDALIKYQSAVFDLRVPDAEKLFRTTRARYQREVQDLFAGLESFGQQSLDERKQIGEGPGHLATHIDLKMQRTSFLDPHTDDLSIAYNFTQTILSPRQDDRTHEFSISRQEDSQGSFNYAVTFSAENSRQTISGLPALRRMQNEVASIRAAFGKQSPFA